MKTFGTEELTINQPARIGGGSGGGSGFVDGRSGLVDGRSGLLFGRSGFADGKSGFVDGRSGFADGRSGFLDGNADVVQNAALSAAQHQQKTRSRAHPKFQGKESDEFFSVHCRTDQPLCGGSFATHLPM